MIAVEYIPIEPSAIKIRRCPALDSVVANKPAYWYLTVPLWALYKDIHGFSKSEIDILKSQSLTTAYWTGDRWLHHSPKQFPTAEAAFQEWQEKFSNQSPATAGKDQP